MCSHLIGNVEIDLADDRAHSQSYFICCLTNRDDGAGGGRTDYINAGRYIDDWERRDGVWAMTRGACAPTTGRGAIRRRNGGSSAEAPVRPALIAQPRQGVPPSSRRIAPVAKLEAFDAK